VARAWGEDTPSEPKSSGGDNEKDKDGEEGEVPRPSHSPLREACPSLVDIYSRQTERELGMPQLKWPCVEIGPSTGSPPQPCLALIPSDLLGMIIVSVFTIITHLFGVL
jgi:hypothetical protein